jgi:predicted transcriptional regulator
MTPEQITDRIRACGSSHKKIADELGISQVAVSLVINRSSVSDRTMRAIARKIKHPVEEVFPEYYLAEPKTKRSKAFGPKGRIRKRKQSTPRP